MVMVVVETLQPAVMATTHCLLCSDDFPMLQSVHIWQSTVLWESFRYKNRTIRTGITTESMWVSIMTLAGTTVVDIKENCSMGDLEMVSMFHALS